MVPRQRGKPSVRHDVAASASALTSPTAVNGQQGRIARLPLHLPNVGGFLGKLHEHDIVVGEVIATVTLGPIIFEPVGSLSPRCQGSRILCCPCPDPCWDLGFPTLGLAAGLSLCPSCLRPSRGTR